MHSPRPSTLPATCRAGSRALATATRCSQKCRHSADCTALGAWVRGTVPKQARQGSGGLWLTCCGAGTWLVAARERVAVRGGRVCVPFDRTVGPSSRQTQPDQPHKRQFYPAVQSCHFPCTAPCGRHPSPPRGTPPFHPRTIAARRRPPQYSQVGRLVCQARSGRTPASRAV